SSRRVGVRCHTRRRDAAARGIPWRGNFSRAAEFARTGCAAGGGLGRPAARGKKRVWWWWLKGNVTPEAITRDLEEMKAKGIGGADIIDAGRANQGGHDQVPHGPDFGSPEWR